MKSRSARLALLVLFVMALGVTAYLFRKSEIARRAETAAADVFNAKARSTSRGILDLRAAQQAYVATGQTGDFWAARVTSTLASVKEGLAALRASAISTDARPRSMPRPDRSRISRRWTSGRVTTCAAIRTSWRPT